MSYVFQETTGFNQGSPWLGYHIMNFNLEEGKEILPGDYFILETKEDSSFLEKVISRAADSEFSFQKFPETLNFAFDDSTVYFLFEKYHPLTWGDVSVEKRYIIDHIHAAYR